MVLYADVLFIIDFSMDVLTLWAAGRMTHSRLNAWRIAVAAAFGGVISVTATALGMGRTAGAVLSAAAAFVMSIIAFGKGKLALVLRRYIVLWLGGILLGGIMTALMSAGSMGKYTDTAAGDGGLVAVIPIGAALLFLLVTFIVRVPKTDFTDIRLCFGERKVLLRAMCDTGNLLEDPFSGESVILVKSDSATELFSKDELAYLMSQTDDPPQSIRSRIRLIPASSLAGESLLRAVRIDLVSVGQKNCSAVVAVSNKIGGGSYNAVISAKLV